MLCSCDNCCCEDTAWQEAAGIPELTHGREQTFYQLLVDAKDWEASWEKPPVAYVAEELLSAPEVRGISVASCVDTCHHHSMEPKLGNSLL